MVGDRCKYDVKSSRYPREGLTFCFGLALQVWGAHPGGEVQQQVDEMWRRRNTGTVSLYAAAEALGT